MLEELEPRLLLSADCGAIALEAVVLEESIEHQTVESPYEVGTLLAEEQVLTPSEGESDDTNEEDGADAALEELEPTLSEIGPEDQAVVQEPGALDADRREIVFVDVDLIEHDAVLEALEEQLSDGTELEVIFVSSSQGGLEQVTEALTSRVDTVDALHFLSATPLGLEDLPFSADALIRHAEEIREWSAILSPGANVFIHAPSVLPSAENALLLDVLENLTGANVVATSGSFQELHGERFESVSAVDGSVSLLGSTSLEGVRFGDLALVERWGGVPVGDPDADTLSVVQPWQRKTAADRIVIPDSAIRSETDAAVAAGELASSQSSDTLSATSDLLARPLGFEPNSGQVDERVDFVARGPGFSVFLGDGGARLALEDRDETHAVDLSLIGANEGVSPVGFEQLAGRTNYIIGADPAHWYLGIPNYGGVTYADIYDGIDIVYRGADGQFQFDFVVAPGTDPGVISWEVDGVQNASVEDSGDLLLLLPDGAGEFRFRAPFTYQLGDDGLRQGIESRYRLNADGTVGFSLGAFDPSRELVIDPVLDWATFMGGSFSDAIADIKVDDSGFVYVTGSANNTFPTTLGSFAPDFASGVGSDAYVAKLTSDGSSQVFSTYYGSTGSDSGRALAVDAAGNIYVAGSVQSSDLPLAGAFDSTLAGNVDAFVAKFSADGSTLLYGSYFGGNGLSNDRAYGIDIDDAGMAYVAGSTDSDQSGNPSNKFPLTAGVVDTTFAGTTEAFVAKFDTTQSGANSLVYATYVGGDGNEAAYDIAIDGSGNAYITGETSSTDFSTVNGYDATYSGSTDAFVTVLNSTATAISYSTYLGDTALDTANGLALDSTGKVVIAGETGSNSYPTTVGAYDTGTLSGNAGFISKLDTGLSGAASLLYSTFVEGVGDDYFNDIAVNSSDEIIASGITFSATMPTTVDALDSALGGGNDAYLAVLDATLSSLLYGTYIGSADGDYSTAVWVDSVGAIYAAGYTVLPTFDNVPSSTTIGVGGGGDGFVLKFRSGSASQIDLDADDSSGASGGDFNTAFTEGSGPTAVTDIDATISDADSINLVSMTVTITNRSMAPRPSSSTPTSGARALPRVTPTAS